MPRARLAAPVRCLDCWPSPQASPGAAAQPARYCRHAEKRAGGRIARGEAGDTWLAVVAGADGGP